MIGAKIIYSELNDEKTANALLHYFEKIRDFEIKHMRWDDARAWKAGKDGAGGTRFRG